MAKTIYIGVANKARKVKRLYIGINGKARKVKKGYIGIGGKAKLFYRSGYGNCPDGLFAISAFLADNDSNIQHLDVSTYAIKASIKGPFTSIAYRTFVLSGTSGKLLICMKKSNKPVSYYYKNTYTIDFPTGVSSKISWDYKSSRDENLNFGSDDFLGMCDESLTKRDPETYAVVNEVVLQNGSTAGSDARNGKICGGDANMCYSSGIYRISYAYAVVNVNNLTTGAYVRTCHCTGTVGTDTSASISSDSLGSQIILEATRINSDGTIVRNYFFTYDKNTGSQITNNVFSDKNISTICTIK